MDPTITVAAIGAASGLVSSLLVAVAGHRLTRRTEVRRERRQAQREAATDLVAPLRHMQACLVRFGRVEVAHAQVSQAFLSWSNALERQKHLLPTDWPSLRHSVRAAVGTVFGAVTLADIRPDLQFTPLAEPDIEWQENAQAYLELMIDRLSRWGASERVRTPLAFDPWLAQRDHRAL